MAEPSFDLDSFMDSVKGTNKPEEEKQKEQASPASFDLDSFMDSVQAGSKPTQAPAAGVSPNEAPSAAYTPFGDLSFTI